MKHIMKKTVFLALVNLFFSISSFANDAWEFEIEPYFMGVNISGDASLGRVDGVDVDVDTHEIIETLNMGAMLHFEAMHESNLGFYLDYSFMDLRGKKNVTQGIVTNADIKQSASEAVGIYRVKFSDKTNLDYLFGLRYWNNEFKVDIDTSLRSSRQLKLNEREDWFDLVLGLRGATKVNNNLITYGHLDFGGFNLQSKFTGSVRVGLKYIITKYFLLDFQYKALWVDYEDGNYGDKNYFKYDTVTSGPIIGLIFKF